MRKLSLYSTAVAAMIVLIGSSGCGKKDKGAGAFGGFAVSVVAQPVSQERIEDAISLVGTLTPDESIEIKNEVNGLIEKLGFEEGQLVKKGQMLFMINADKLNAGYSQAEANLSLAQTTFDRLSSLIKAGAVSQQEYDQAKSNLDAKKAEIELIKAQLAETVISAPFDGVMGERKVSIGQFVNQGTSLSFLVKLDPMKAEFRVPERYLGQLKEGQTIEVAVAAYPDKKFGGSVYFIDPKVEEETRTALVKAKLPNPDGNLRGGMFANLNLIVSIRETALLVPETAIIPKGEDVFVFVVDKDSKAQMKKVKIGIRLVGKIEVQEGLQAGEQVIVEGYQKIGPGSLVKINALSDTQPVKGN